ncbi:MAG: 1-acyl-sn-glycerol-3-phosphate acyltransferase [Oscillospiraceae bacterium]|nr:1-acyl-sn-glycerol-3-phosphate acyltransferase [Oscillospiraceae bacterium]
MQKKKTRKKWTKYRHRVVRNIAYGVLYPYSKWKYGITVERFKEQGDSAYLILLNHQTPFDQFFVGMSFKGAVYYLASEDLFSNGWISSVIRWLVAPIPIKKQTMDIGAVMNCIRVAKEGGTIAIAPEGNRTYSGKTEYMSPAIASLARKLGLPIALYRIEGGYGAQPRWSDVIRKGKMRAYVSRVIAPEEYSGLTNEELFAIIKKELAVNEGVSDGLFLSNKRAEYLERAIYVCPYCGLSEFESKGNEIECKKCHRKIAYGEDKRLTGVGFSFPFAYVTQWYDYQKAFVGSLDVTQYTQAPIYRDTASLTEVIVNKQKLLLRKTADIFLYGDRIVIDEGGENALTFPFHDVSAVSVLGRNKLNIYHGDKVYQLKGGKRMNALKYVNFYYLHKNVRSKEENAVFLGI